MALTNHQFRLAARPVGTPKREDWTYAEEPVRELNDGEFLVKIEYISLDPAMRGWMNEGRSYIPPVGIGEVMRANSGGHVVASKNPKFAAGDAVTGLFGVQEYAISNGEGVNKVDTKAAPLSQYLGILGMPGLTAYFGLLDIGKPKPGDTVVISGAAGAVGTVAGQIAKIKGCRAIGIAGGRGKCDYLVNELGFDAAIDYKAGEVKEGLKEHCPKGINIYFDNVGGDILDAVLVKLAFGARIVLCGAISQYNTTAAPKGPSKYMALLVYRASMTGFMVMDYVKQHPQALQEMSEWMAAGKLKNREEIVTGFETFPETFLMLFTGGNTGKLLLQVTEG